MDLLKTSGDRCWSAAALFVVLAYGVYFATRLELPMQDLPSHLARCYVISRLWFFESSGFESTFSIETVFAPYFLGDALFAWILAWFSPRVGERIWVIACVCLLPLAVWLYTWTRGWPRSKQVLAVLTAAVLATDWSFLAGYLHYRFGLILFFTALAFWELWARRGGLNWFLLYSVTCAAGYLMHLSCFVFLCCALAFMALYRLYRKELSIIGVAVTALPLVLLLIHFVSDGLVRGDGGKGTLVFRDPLNKILAIAGVFVRFSYAVDLALFGLLFALALAPFLLARVSGRRSFEGPYGARNFEALLTAILFVVVYAALPVAMRMLQDIDGRALPLVCMFAVLAAPIELLERGSRGRRIVLTGVTTLALVNLLVLGMLSRPLEQLLASYREALATIPQGAKVLPVAVEPDHGRVQGELHFGDLAVMEKGRISPYLFSGNRHEPQFYFRYQTLPPAPPIFWYLRGEPPKWDETLPAYDYMIVGGDVDETRLPMSRLRQVSTHGKIRVFSVGK